MKILIVGSGGREHALAWKIAQSPLVTELFCAPGNAGTALVGQNVDLAAENVSGLAGIDLMVGGGTIGLHGEWGARESFAITFARNF